MREWMFGSSQFNLSSEELYFKERLKCDGKCLMYSQENEKEDICIVCNDNNGYYPVIKIGNSDEDYECHKKDEKLEKFYFSNEHKAFLSCYETCRYCNESGDSYNHIVQNVIIIILKTLDQKILLKLLIVFLNVIIIIIIMSMDYINVQIHRFAL